MKISIFGLGYVGYVTAACFAKLGHEVIGIDIKKEKVESLKRGISPIYEKGLKEILDETEVKKKLKFTTDVKTAIQNSDISFICVGTPSLPSGELNFQYVEKVAAEIGKELKNKGEYHLIVIRSTVFPGLVHSRIVPVMEKESGKTAFVDFGISMHPEFLREGSAIEDFLHAHKIIIGGDDEKSISMLKSLYNESNFFPEEIIHTVSIKQAQMIKYVDNIFHALKVVFANEIGTIAHDLDIDSQELIDLFVKDRKLNLSPYYFRPGFAYGGSCLPKDLRAFLFYARVHNHHIPLIESIEKSNIMHIERAAQLIQKQLKRNIGFLGITFKSNTDDIRENPIFPLINLLIEKGYIPLWEKGYVIKLYDEHIAKKDVSKLIPQYSDFFASSEEEFLDSVELIVISNDLKESKVLDKAIKKGIQIIDLQGIVNKSTDYENIIALC